MQPRFLQQSNDRRLPPEYAGDVLVWDIDKTYLDTRFSSFRGLLSIPFELAVDKHAIPGSVPLLRALRRGPGETSALVPLYFISGSPVQLRSVIEKKMTLDGVGFDGITFKDQFGLLMNRRAKDIKSQVGYKLKALLMYRRMIPSTARWIMFGDDVEQDADAFSLFGEVCAGLRGHKLEAELTRFLVSSQDQEEINALLEGLPKGENPVERIFIHLSNKSNPESFDSRRVAACKSYLQAAVLLQHMGRIDERAAFAVAKSLRRAMTPEAKLREELQDAEARLGVPASLTEQLR